MSLRLICVIIGSLYAVDTSVDRATLHKKPAIVQKQFTTKTGAPIKIFGCKHVSENRIIKLLGKTTDLEQMKKNLMDSDLFENVTLKMQDNIIILNVTEGKYIRMILYESFIPEEQLKQMTGLSPGIITKSTLEKSIDRVKKIIQTQDQNVSVEVYIDDEDQLTMSVNTLFSISVYDVQFLGTKNIDTKELLKGIAEANSKIGLRTEQANTNFIQMYKHFIVERAVSMGYRDFQIEDISVIPVDKIGNIRLVVKVKEGVQYSLENCYLHAPVLDQDTIDALQYDIDELLLYDQDIRFLKLQSLIDGMKRVIANKYQYMNVSYEITPNETEKTVEVTITVKESYKYIDKIQVTGNKVTDKQIVLTVTKLFEGMRFTDTILDDAQQRLMSLGLFHDANVSVTHSNGRMKTITVKLLEWNHHTQDIDFPAFSLSSSSRHIAWYKKIKLQGDMQVTLGTNNFMLSGISVNTNVLVSINKRQVAEQNLDWSAGLRVSKAPVLSANNIGWNVSVYGNPLGSKSILVGGIYDDDDEQKGYAFLTKQALISLQYGINTIWKKGEINLDVKYEYAGIKDKSLSSASEIPDVAILESIYEDAPRIRGLGYNIPACRLVLGQAPTDNDKREPWVEDINSANLRFFPSYHNIGLALGYKRLHRKLFKVFVWHANVHMSLFSVAFKPRLYYQRFFMSGVLMTVSAEAGIVRNHPLLCADISEKENILLAAKEYFDSPYGYNMILTPYSNRLRMHVPGRMKLAGSMIFEYTKFHTHVSPYCGIYTGQIWDSGHERHYKDQVAFDEYMSNPEEYRGDQKITFQTRNDNIVPGQLYDQTVSGWYNPVVNDGFRYLPPVSLQVGFIVNIPLMGKLKVGYSYSLNTSKYNNTRTWFLSRHV